MQLSVSEAPKMGRTMRRPEHIFQLRVRPYHIQPMMLAPVIPGETLKNLLLQARVVSDPVKNPLIGWWAEYYFFYVKHRDLDDRDTFLDMFVDPTKDMSAMNSAAETVTYHSASSINYAQKCLRRVTDCYFRNEGETYATATDSNLPLAAVTRTSALDSAILDSAYYRPDVNVDLNANATITASEVDAALQTWNWLRSNGLTDQSYEDFLGTYGVRTPRALREEKNWPELVRYVREWTYPANTVNPSTGVPSSALSWSITERADKDRFFNEPGFLFGCQVIRPKVYFSKQNSSVADWMNDVYSWLPAVMRDDPTTSMKKFAGGAGPFANVATAYWVDLRDLFLYGDQFVNFALTETDAGMVALPTTTMGKRYVSSADMDALFSAASPANKIRSDGVVRLSIASSTVDRTATTN